MQSSLRTYVDQRERQYLARNPTGVATIRQAIEPRQITIPGVAIIHTHYDPDDIPPLQGPEYTRIICVSDTHTTTFPVPDGDVLLHAGDLSLSGKLHELSPTTSWLRNLTHQAKIFIAGNHDVTLDMDWYDDNWSTTHVVRENPLTARDLVRGHLAHSANMIYLEYQTARFKAREGGKEWRFFGSPGTPGGGDLAFHYPEDEAEETNAQIPPDTDILITHGPPLNILDTMHNGRHCGCPHLLARVEEIKPRIHVFGRIHEGHGVHVREWEDGSKTIFVNAASFPAGRLAIDATNNGHIAEIGGYNFQPVIIDLYDVQSPPHSPEDAPSPAAHVP